MENNITSNNVQQVERGERVLFLLQKKKNQKEKRVVCTMVGMDTMILCVYDRCVKQLNSKLVWATFCHPIMGFYEINIG
jgi:hypothetical protein